MTDIIQLGPHENMTPQECLALCKRASSDYTEVIVIGYDLAGDFVSRSSAMSRKDALWLLMAAIDYARGISND